MPRSRVRSLIVLFATLAILGAACSKDTGDKKAGTKGATAGGSADGKACEAPGVTDTEITLGALYPKSGTTATQFVPFGAGALARIGVENEKGGVNGRMLKLVESDDGNETARNLAGARELVESKGVFGIVEAAPRAPGSAKYLAAEGVPVTGWPINYVWGLHDNMFGYGGSSSPKPAGEVVTTGAKFMIDKGGKNLAAVGFAGSPESAASARNQAKAFESVGGKVGYLTTDVPFGSTEFTADVQRMKDAKVDTLGGSITADSFVPLFLAAKQAGIDFKVVLSPTGYDQRLVEAVGKQMTGVYFNIDFAPFEMDLPAHKTFADAMAKYSPSATPAKQQIAMVGWLSADIFIRGLHEAGKCLTRERFVANLRKVKDYDADGLLLRPVDQSKAFGNPSLCVNYVQVAADGSKFELVEGATPFCGKVKKG